jgi:hypothetical protein
MKVNGKMIKHLEWENMFMLMGLNIQENGKMINKMEEE